MSGTVPVGRRGVAQKQEDGPVLTEVLSMRLSAVDVERLNAAAENRGVDASTLARELLRLGLALEGPSR